MIKGRWIGQESVYGADRIDLMSKHAWQIVLTTCPDSMLAERIAEALVTEKLAACVNILPMMRSIYAWKGKVESAQEHLLIVKGTASNYAAIEGRIRALHTYELPEIIGLPIVAGLPAYLAWLQNPDAA